MYNDVSIDETLARALDSHEIGCGDAQALLGLRGSDVFRVCIAADSLRKTLVGDVVTYVVNRNINFTNMCTGTCRFCGFKDSEPYLLTEDEVVQRAMSPELTEVCIQGGLNPSVPLEYYIGIVEAIKEQRPELHIHAFSPAEVDHMAKTSGQTHGSVIRELKKAGLGSMPGTAAEILVDSVRSVICPDKIDTATWEKIIREAHGQGIPTTSTMMYGHVESIADMAAHMGRIRDIQKDTGGFTEFVPLSFMPENKLGRAYGLTGAPGHLDLLTYAVSRLFFADTIKNIQTSWVKLGRKMTQVSLMCGANDVGGTLVEEKISKSSGAGHGECMTRTDLEKMIAQTGKIARQRTTTYSLV